MFEFELSKFTLQVINLISVIDFSKQRVADCIQMRNQNPVQHPR